MQSGMYRAKSDEEDASDVATAASDVGSNLDPAAQITWPVHVNVGYQLRQNARGAITKPASGSTAKDGNSPAKDAAAAGNSGHQSDGSQTKQNMYIR